MSSPVDDRIWLPDANEVFDWEKILKATEQRFGGLATWWMQATAGVNYYRAELPSRHLPGKALLLDTRDLQEVDGEVVVPRQEGPASIWLFPGNTTRALIMVQLKNLGYRVLVEVDDNYTRQPPMLEVSTWLNRRDQTKEDRHSFEVHQHIVKHVADGVICSTQALADLYSRMNDNVYVCRNAIDPTDWPEEATHSEDGVLRIGWAGSASHRYDLGDIRQALDWASRQKDVEVVLFGHAETMGSLIEQPNVRHIGWVDGLQDYRQQLGVIDVMLCPLRPSAWANCKSDVKALEAAMAGAVPVVSRTEPYRPWWDGEAPGYVADTKKGFVKIVKHLVANREEARQAAHAAKDYVLAHRDIRNSVSEWREAILA